MKLALCTGINQYPGTSSDLAGCVNDCLDLAEVLTARGFEVSTLLDEQATSHVILDALKILIGKATYGDVLFFSFSGHGSWIVDDSGDEPDGRDEILCTHDIFDGGWISDDQIRDVFSHRAYGVRLIMFSDSCHSGSVSRFSRRLAPPPQAAKVKFLPPAAFLKDEGIMDVRGITGRRAVSTPGKASEVLFSGCQDNQFSYDAYFGDRPNGAFTRAAIDSLAENPTTYADWMKRIRTRLPSAEYPQNPSILGARDRRLWPVLEEGR